MISWYSKLPQCSINMECQSSCKFKVKKEQELDMIYLKHDKRNNC